MAESLRVETMRTQPPHFDVLGIPVDACTPASTLAVMRDTVASKTKACFVFLTASSVLSARDDDNVRDALLAARLLLPDGMPLVWLGRRRNLIVERVYGPDFIRYLLTTTNSEFRHYFFGSSDEVLRALIDQLGVRFPEARIVGGHAPSQALEARVDATEDVARINAASPDVVWIGLGHPKQELWMHAHRDELDAPVLAGVGAAFDFLSGTKREAPEWMKRSGLQWAHRLGSEPRRLWRRYLVGNARFAFLLARERLSRREANAG